MYILMQTKERTNSQSNYLFHYYFLIYKFIETGFLFL